MKRSTILYSALLIGALAHSTISQVYAEDVAPINSVENEQMMMVSLPFNSPKNLKKEIKKMILDEYIKEHPEKSDIDYDKTEITLDKEIDLTDKNAQIKKVSINFHYSDKSDVSLVPDLVKQISLSVTEGDPVLELKKTEISIVKTTDYDLNSLVTFSGSYNGVSGAFTIDTKNFDKNQVGKYEIEYKYADVTGKIATQKLTVNVTEQKTFFYNTDGELLGEADGIQDETAFPEIADYNITEQKTEGGNQFYILEKKPYVAPVQNTRGNTTQSINYQPIIAGGDYVQQALSAVGRVPYVWGGVTPDGWDCSGMVQYLTGIGARTAEQQSYTGTRHYDIYNAPYGALYFYDTGAGAYHVGISLGNGSMVHAANANDGTIVTNIQYFTPTYWVMPGQ